MSARPTFVNDDILEYLRKYSSSEDDFLKSLRKEGKKHKIPDIAISSEQGSFLQFLIKLTNTENILEIGTLAGYSAITMARALPENGYLTTIEINKYNAEFSQRKIDESDVRNKINLINADALDYLKNLELKEKFDFIFLDADKENYKKYIDLLIPVIKKGGILSIDNAFAFGLINEKDDSKIESDKIFKIREFNEYFINHSEFGPTTIVPVGDGLLMGIKK